jgi:dCTP deaminase
MAILTKAAILQAILYQRIRMTPFNKDISDSQIGPNSIDLTLGNAISFYPFVKLEDEGEFSGGGDTITIGQTSVDTRPEDYGHFAMKMPMDPDVQYLREMPLMDLGRYQDTYQTEIPENGFVLWPGNVYLVKVNETLWAKDLVIKVSGLSSLARAGLSVNQSADMVNVGDEVQLVLELSATYPTVIYPNMRIAAAYFETTEGELLPENEYHGRYEQKKQPNPGIIAGYVPDRWLVEKVAAMRAQAAEEAAAEEAAYRAAHPEEFVDEAPPTDGFVDGTIGMQPVSEEVPVEEPATPLQPGESMDMSDLMPGFSAEVASTETTGEVDPQEFDAEITSTETPEA